MCNKAFKQPRFLLIDECGLVRIFRRYTPMIFEKEKEKRKNNEKSF